MAYFYFPDSSLVFIMEKSLQQIETELKKRLAYPYVWGQKQNNVWDGHTNFIYRTDTWEELLPKMAEVCKTHDLDKHQVFQYTINRWYNFWSSVAVEKIFCQIEGVRKAENSKDKYIDFNFFGIDFDHKTSVFPKHFQKEIKFAQNNERELIDWLYKNQSSEKRHHNRNRLFIIVYNNGGEHWKLKCELTLLKHEIENYAASFEPEQLHSLTFADGQKALSDIIWLVR